MTENIFEKLKDFPDENKRKDAIFNSFNDILKALGFYINNNEAKFERVKENDKEYIVMTYNNQTFKQSITNDSCKSMFSDILKLVLKNCEETKGIKEELDSCFEEKE